MCSYEYLRDRKSPASNSKATSKKGKNLKSINYVFNISMLPFKPEYFNANKCCNFSIQYNTKSLVRERENEKKHLMIQLVSVCVSQSVSQSSLHDCTATF